MTKTVRPRHNQENLMGIARGGGEKRREKEKGGRDLGRQA